MSQPPFEGRTRWLTHRWAASGPQHQAESRARRTGSTWQGGPREPGHGALPRGRPWLRGRCLLDAAQHAGRGAAAGGRAGRGARDRPVGRVRRAGRGRPARGGGRRAARQAGGGDVPERDHGPAGRPARPRRPPRLLCGSGSPRSRTCCQHEDDGPRLVHGFRFEHLSTGRDLPTVADVERLGAGLGAILLELPLRDAGCLLPEWDDLVAITAKARELGAAVHLDGARIWESQPFYDRPLPRSPGVGDSDLRLLLQGARRPGRAPASPARQDVVEEARRWRKRMGGTLFHLTPLAVSALAGLRDYLPKMPEYVAWGRSLATHLVAAGVRVNPDPPHTNTFELFAEGEPDAINERVIAFMERTRRPALRRLAGGAGAGGGHLRGGRARLRAAARPRGGGGMADGDHRTLTEEPIERRAAGDAGAGQPPLDARGAAPPGPAGVELRVRRAAGARPRAGRAARPRRGGRGLGLGRVRRLAGAVRRPDGPRRRRRGGRAGSSTGPPTAPCARWRSTPRST